MGPRPYPAPLRSRPITSPCGRAYTLRPRTVYLINQATDCQIAPFSSLPACPANTSGPYWGEAGIPHPYGGPCSGLQNGKWTILLTVPPHLGLPLPSQAALRAPPLGSAHQPASFTSGFPQLRAPGGKASPAAGTPLPRLPNPELSSQPQPPCPLASGPTLPFQSPCIRVSWGMAWEPAGLRAICLPSKRHLSLEAARALF